MHRNTRTVAPPRRAVAANGPASCGIRVSIDREHGIQRWEFFGELSARDWLASITGIARIPGHDACPRVLADARCRRIKQSQTSFANVAMVGQAALADETSARFEFVYLAPGDQAEANDAAREIERSGFHRVCRVASLDEAREALHISRRRASISRPRPDVAEYEITPRTTRWAHVRPIDARAERCLDQTDTLPREEHRSAKPAVIATRLDQLGLSPRQRDVVEAMLARGDAQRVADELSISLFTVRNHLKAIYKKARVGSALELLATLIATRKDD